MNEPAREGGIQVNPMVDDLTLSRNRLAPTKKRRMFAYVPVAFPQAIRLQETR